MTDKTVLNFPRNETDLNKKLATVLRSRKTYARSVQEALYGVVFHVSTTQSPARLNDFIQRFEGVYKRDAVVFRRIIESTIVADNRIGADVVPANPWIRDLDGMKFLAHANDNEGNPVYIVRKGYKVSDNTDLPMLAVESLPESWQDWKPENPPKPFEFERMFERLRNRVLKEQKKLTDSGLEVPAEYKAFIAAAKYIEDGYIISETDFQPEAEKMLEDKQGKNGVPASRDPKLITPSGTGAKAKATAKISHKKASPSLEKQAA